METRELYGFVLNLVLIGMVLGVGVLVLDKFMASSGLTSNAVTSINGTINAITPMATTWLPLIVTVAALGIILYMVIRSFGSFRG